MSKVKNKTLHTEAKLTFAPLAIQKRMTMIEIKRKKNTSKNKILSKKICKSPKNFRNKITCNFTKS